jgi:glycosyltransferase involved in cell wall biosynthesis
MRALFDHQIFSYQTFGGASRYYCELMNAFHRDGEPGFDLGVAESPNEYLASAPYYRGTRRPRPAAGKRGTAALFRTYARNELFERSLARARPYDILHATFYDPGVLRHVRDARLVVTVLDMIPERYPDYFDTRSLYGRFVTRRWIEGKRALCKRADAILAISERTKQDVVSDYGIDPARITVTHLGNNLSGGLDQPRPTGFPGRYVLFVGTRNTYKNFALFIEAVALLLREDPSLHVVCIGGGALVPSEHELVRREGIADRVVQRNVADSELAPSYAHAEAFVFPSLYEGFGIPIIEAFACGCPTLVADASCFPEIAGDAAVYFDPADRDSLAGALRRVLGDHELRASLRAAGLERAKLFTWERTARETLAVYRAA